MIRKGEIYWVDLGEPRGSEPGYRRPAVIVQCNPFNNSRIATVIVVVLTSNLALAKAPGNVLLPKSVTSLAKDSVANISQILTLDRTDLDESPVGMLPKAYLADLDDGLALVLGLQDR